MDKPSYDKAITEFNRVYGTADVYKEYLEFSRFMQAIFISPDGYIVDTGNFRTVNRELMDRIKDAVEKHPLVFRAFFEVA